MNNKIVLLLLSCALILFSFKADEKSEAFGKQFFKLLKASPETSKAKIEASFITLKALKTFPKNEIAEFSQERFNEFIAHNISELQENAKGYKIVWKNIQYIKTESKADSDYGIDLQVIQLYFKHDVHTFKLQLVTIPHKNKLKLIRIMYLDYVAD